MTLNSAAVAETNGIASFIDFATPATNKAKIQALIDMIQVEATQAARGNLDQMSPTARVHLLVELEALHDAVSNV